MTFNLLRVFSVFTVFSVVHLSTCCFADDGVVRPNDALLHLKAAIGSAPSHVVGSPDPPPPYHVARTLPELKLSWPIFLATIPGTRNLLFIDQGFSYGPSRICRSTGQSDPAYEKLFEFPGEGVATSIVFHPHFVENGYIYVGWNGIRDGGEKRSMVTRYTLERGESQRLDPKSELNIIEWPSNGHNGVAIAFGLDGMLYVTSGDGTSDSDTNVKGQGLDHLLSKVLRIDVDHPREGQTYAVPADNPFVGKAGVRPETWAYGFRNPWRMTVDPHTGDLWVGNNGQDLWEQIFLVKRGANYGWSVYEGSHLFYPNRELGPTPLSAPRFEHSHSEARSLTGGVVYNGPRFPELQGAYLYADYSTGKIWAGKVEHDEVVWHKEIADSTLQITCIGLDADGELLISDHRGNDEGGFYTLVKTTPAGDASATFPRTLSESGLFASAPDHRLHAGLIPYSVNAPLWSDGAWKERYLYLPPNTPSTKTTGAGPQSAEPGRIDFMPTRGWNFPDKTVLVKSFALQMEDGNPASRRWIETRFLTKQEGEWVGYSYMWNDEQTEAVLVDRDGLDRPFEIRAGSDTRTQTWHYPSRTECMVCHSRAANFVLGLSTLQMNRDHDYDGLRVNQLAVFEWLGILPANWTDEFHKSWGESAKSAGKSESEIEAQKAQWSAARRKHTSLSTLLSFQPPNGYPKLVDPYDDHQDLEARARSYLHANCAQCHVEAGGGNAQFDVDYTTSLDRTKLIDIKPQHHTYGIEEARLIAPGDADRSLVLSRMAHRGPGQMPQLATSQVDRQAVQLVRKWIEAMPNK